MQGSLPAVARAADPAAAHAGVPGQNLSFTFDRRAGWQAPGRTTFARRAAGDQVHAVRPLPGWSTCWPRRWVQPVRQGAEGGAVKATPVRAAAAAPCICRRQFIPTTRENSPIKSLIAQGSQITGNVRFTDGRCIDGTLVGDIHASEDQPSILAVSESASVTGALHADHIIISGTVGGPHANLMLSCSRRRASRATCITGRSRCTRRDHCGSAAAAGRHRRKALLKLAANNP